MKPCAPLAALAVQALATAAPADDRAVAGQSPFGAVAPKGSPGFPALELRGIMSGEPRAPRP
jgi:hypothetical protein